MRSVLLRTLAVVGAGGLVLAGVLYVASTVDARAPQVVGIRLTQTAGDDARVGLITTSLEIAFSEPVEAEDAADSVSLRPSVDGAVSWSGSTMILTPADPLQLESAYTLHIEPGIHDVAGNAMTEVPPPWEFTTSGRPTLVQSVPEDGGEDVPLEEPIALTFSSLMDTASVEAALRLRPSFGHELRWSGSLLEIVPTQPLRAGQRYEVSIQDDAADAAGVALAEALLISFETVSPGLAVETLVPADGVDGIAATSPIAVIFDRPIDPASADEGLLVITPELAGTLEVVALPDDPASPDGAGSLLRFTPSGPLPPNTTFEVELAVGVTAPEDGGGMGGPVSWSFTTGAPLDAISNRITFITDRAGVANVWAMNADGSGQRQVSAELLPIVDYAVAPDGSSLVLADGYRLVHQRADGSDRQVLTGEGLVEFDPTYSPNGRRIAFGRSDAETGEGLGLWEWVIGGGDPTPIVLPDDPEAGPTPSGLVAAAALRAPRYAPDGEALAFADLDGRIGILDLPAGLLSRLHTRRRPPRHGCPMDLACCWAARWTRRSRRNR